MSHKRNSCFFSSLFLEVLLNADQHGRSSLPLNARVLCRWGLRIQHRRLPYPMQLHSKYNVPHWLQSRYSYRCSIFSTRAVPSKKPHWYWLDWCGSMALQYEISLLLVLIVFILKCWNELKCIHLYFYEIFLINLCIILHYLMIRWGGWWFLFLHQVMFIAWKLPPHLINVHTLPNGLTQFILIELIFLVYFFCNNC